MIAGQHRVAFWRRPTERCPIGSRGMHLVIRSVATNEERVYTEGFLESAPIIWTRDGRSILTGAQTRPGRSAQPIVRFLRLDIESGQSITMDTSLRVGTFGESRGLPGALSLDNRTLYVKDWNGESSESTLGHRQPAVALASGPLILAVAPRSTC